MITVGSWITPASGKGIYLVADIDGDMVTLRDVILDNKGVAYYGKERMFKASELKNYKMA